MLKSLQVEELRKNECNCDRAECSSDINEVSEGLHHHAEKRCHDYDQSSKSDSFDGIQALLIVRYHDKLLDDSEGGHNLHGVRS